MSEYTGCTRDELIQHIANVYDDIVYGSFPQTFDEVVGHFDADNAHFGVHRIDGVVVGHWIVKIDWRTPHRGSVAVAVERQARGVGVGHALLCAAQRWAEEFGLEWLEGSVWEDNEPAVRMDTTFGFDMVGRIVDAWRSKDGSPRVLILLAKRIGG